VDCVDDENDTLVVKRNDKNKDTSKVRFFSCHKTGHYDIQCPNKKEKKPKSEVSTSTEIAEFVERNEREFSLMNSPLGNGFLVFKDIEVWFVENGANRHMKGMRSVFPSLSEIDSYCCVGVGTSPQCAVKGVGSVRLQLDSGGFLEFVGLLYVLEMMVNLVLVLTLEVDGFGVAFYCGRVFLYLEGDTPGTTMMLGVGYERLYRLLGRPMLGSNGFLDSDSMSESGHVARERELIPVTHSSSETLRGLNRHEWT
jgi:hypothetical protein